MYKIDSIGSVDGHFSDGDYEVAKKGTQVVAEWLNALQNEMCNLVLFLGLEPSEDNDQILQGLNSYMNSYFTRQYIEEYIDDVDDNFKDIGDSITVPYQGIIDVSASLSLLNVVGGGFVEVAIYDDDYVFFINGARIPISEGEDLKIIIRLVAENNDSEGRDKDYHIIARCSSGCSASGRININGSIISKRITYAQD